MVTIERKSPPTNEEVELFLRSINLQLPEGFIDFFRGTNGADVNGNDGYAVLWPLTDLLKFNKAYKVETYAPEFFLFGSDGGGTAYAIERNSGDIYEMPFIGMSREEAVFKSKSFNEFLESF